MTRDGDTRLFTGFFSETIDIIVREEKVVSRSRVHYLEQLISNEAYT